VPFERQLSSGVAAKRVYMGTVVLVRHGESTWNRERRVQGLADSTLTDRGREQARAVGAHLAEEYAFDRVVASDLRRAEETARVVCDCDGLPAPELDRVWRERDYGQFQGLTRSSIAARHRSYQHGRSLLSIANVPGGEPRLALERRVTDGWHSLRDSLAGDDQVLVITHGGPIRVVLAAVLDRTLSTFANEFSPGNCSVTELAVEDDVSVVRQNDTGFLDG
jgi:probable phosphoglycerate mutase